MRQPKYKPLIIPLDSTLDCWELDLKDMDRVVACPFLSDGNCGLPAALALVDPTIESKDVASVLVLIPDCCPLAKRMSDMFASWDDEIFGPEDLGDDTEETKVFDRAEVEDVLRALEASDT